MYIDPSNYGSPMEALMNTAEEIDRDKIELEKCIGGGKVFFCENQGSRR